VHRVAQATSLYEPLDSSYLIGNRGRGGADLKDAISESETGKSSVKLLRSLIQMNVLEERERAPKRTLRDFRREHTGMRQKSATQDFGVGRRL
jgi:hypothetical protein